MVASVQTDTVPRQRLHDGTLPIRPKEPRSYSDVLMERVLPIVVYAHLPSCAVRPQRVAAGCKPTVSRVPPCAPSHQRRMRENMAIQSARPRLIREEHWRRRDGVHQIKRSAV